MKFFKLISICMVGLLLISCSKKGDDTQEEKKVSERDVSPLKVGEIITLKGVEGGGKKLKRIKGGFELVGEEDKLLILDIFGTFCPPCQEEAPSLTKFQIDYNQKVVLVGLSFLENVTNEYIKENFSDKYNAHYFIAKNDKTPQIVRSIVEDISYPRAVQLPFKVVLKNGKYQTVTDVWEKSAGVKYFLGNVGVATIKNDIDNILSK